MSILSRVARTIRNVVRGGGVERERELDLEVTGYLDLLVDEKIAKGMDPRAARRAAQIEIGGREQVKEQVRERRAGAALEQIAGDARYAVRVLARTPAFTIAALGAMTLGIGAITAVFSIVNGVLLQPLPYPAADRLVVAHVSVPESRDLGDGVTAFESWGLWASNRWSVPNGDTADEMLGAVVDDRFFNTLGTPAAIGSTITPENFRQPVAVISHGLWQRRFGGSPSVLGSTIVFGQRAHTVVGVMPASFQYPSTAFEVWSPVVLGPAEDSRALRIFRMIGRVRDGVPLSTAQGQADAVAARLAREFPATNRDVDFQFRPISDIIVGPVSQALWIALAMAGVLLVVTCANVASLLLARAASRDREMALRGALGAGRARLARQLLVESLVLGAIGGLAGLACAWLMIRALPALLVAQLPRTDAIEIDLTVLGFTALASMVTATLFGLAPLRHAVQAHLTGVLGSGSRAAGRVEGRRVRSALVVAEIALALVLVVAAGLLGRSFLRLLNVQPGFRTERLLTFTVQLWQFPSDDVKAQMAEAVIERLRSVPGVEGVGGSSGLPVVTPQRAIRLVPDGGSVRPTTALFMGASSGYFGALGATVTAGREFTDADRRGGQPVVLVNRTLARELFPDGNVVGRRLRLEDPRQSSEWRTIVGVVEDVKYRGLNEEAGPSVYTPFSQTPFLWSYVVVRTSGDPRPAVRSLAAAVRATHPSMIPAGVATMEQLMGTAVSQPRLNLLLITTFAGLGLALAAAGVYGLVAYGVAQRTREIGVRVALGATRGQVLRLVVRDGMRLAALGTVLGAAVAAAAMRALGTLLFETSPTDPLTFVAVAAVVLAAALAASYIPGRRALQVQPAAALRSE